jgi:aminocarboxymuconate-semialdehyde decarboxylase
MSEPWNKYDLTAARVHGRPGREVRPSSITIDCHAHIFAESAADYVSTHMDVSRTPTVKGAVPETIALQKKQGADRTPVMVPAGMDQRLRDMEAMGLDMQLVMPAPYQCYYAVEAEVGVKAARMVNEGVAEYIAKRTDRFAALGTVPLQDGKAAADELEYCMTELGFRGVQILTNINGAEISDPDTAPFWAAAERLGAVVSIHPAGFTQAERLARFYFNNVIGNPFDTNLALHYLIFDGVLERHPALKVLAVHGGRVPGRLFRAYRSCLGRPVGRAWRSSAPAEHLSQACLGRHHRLHRPSARGAGEGLWPGQGDDGHRLPVRHGRVRPDRPCNRDGTRSGCDQGGGRRNRGAVVWNGISG